MDSISPRKYRGHTILGNSRRSSYGSGAVNVFKDDRGSDWIRGWDVVFHYRDLSGILEKCYVAVGKSDSLQLLGDWTAGSTADKVACGKKNRDSVYSVCAAGGNMAYFSIRRQT